MDRITQKEFVEAYRWIWGDTIKNAKDEYKITNIEYHKTVVESYKRQCKLAFMRIKEA